MHAQYPLYGLRSLLLAFFFVLSNLAHSQTPINDDPCPTDANPPIDLTATNSHFGTTCQATFDYGNIDCGSESASVWYTYTPSISDDGYDIILSPAGGTDDAEGPISVEIYNGTTLQGCSGFTELLGSSCSNVNATISIPNNFNSGEIIYVKVTTDAAEDNCGEFNISVNLGNCGIFADECGDVTGLQTFNPTTLDFFTFTYDCLEGCISYANPDLTAVGGCEEFADNPTVWYKVNTDANAAQLFTTVESLGNWDALWSVYGGDDCSALEIMITEGETCSNGDLTPDLFQIAVIPDYTTYWIAVTVDPNSVPITGLENGAFNICVATTINAIICLGEITGDCAEESLVIEVTEREFEGQSLDGPFCPGEEVTINVSFFYDAFETSSDWLNGLVPKFGPGWNLDDFDYNAFAPSGNGLTAEWLEEGGPCAAQITENLPHLCTYIDENGNLALCNSLCESCTECLTIGMTENDPLPSGYFWVTDGPSSGCANDCTPQSGWGIGNTIVQIDWEFTLRVKDYVDYETCFANNDLQISFQTFSHGVVGCWEDPIGECLIDKSQFGPLWKVDCIIPPTIEADNQSICTGGTTDITVSTIDGSTNTIIVEVEDNPNITGEMNYEFPSGSGVITDILTNTTGFVQFVTYNLYAEDLTLSCSQNITTIEVSVYPNLFIELDPSFVCEGDCTTIINEAGGGDGGPYNYVWSTGETTPFIEVCPLVPTTYSITITDEVGCTATDEVLITVAPPVELSLPETLIVCKDDNFDPINPDYTVCLDFLSGTPIYTVDWISDPGLVGGTPFGIFGECFIINELASSQFGGTNEGYILTAVVVDQNGCTGEAEMLISIQGDLLVVLEAIDLECGDTESSIFLTGFDATGDPITTFLLYGGCPDDGTLGDFLGEVNTTTGTATFPTLDLLAYTCYTVLGQSEGGCMATQNITIPIPVGEPIDITGTTNVCQGEEANITIVNASDYISFEWSPDIGNSGSITFTPDSTVTYFVEATSNSGCTSQQEFTVFVNAADDPLCANPCENQMSDFQITGIAYSDNNGNGMQDAGELPLSNVLIKDLVNDFTVFTNIFGVYVIPVDEGDAILQASFSQGQWENPEINSIVIVEIPCVESVDFGFVPSIIINDANISVTNSITRCDFETKFYITVENQNHESFNGRVEFTFDDKTSYFTSDISGIQVSNNTATFETGVLLGFTPKTFIITLKMPGGSAVLPMLDFTAKIYDDNLLLDTYAFSDQLRCSYDPNDKRTYPDRAGDINPTLKDEELEYTIRFQNNGNDTAFHVRIVDLIDPNIIKSSIRFISASHTYDACISGDSLIIDFANIMLVDSMTNYLGSQGYVSFSCELDSTVVFETEIFNTADIIFDTNDPIVTNTTLNTIVEFLCTDTSTDVSEVICQGENYLDYDETGNYQFTLITDLGCDSIINLDLVVIEPINATTSDVIACGDSEIIDIMGTSYEFDSSGTYIIEIEGPSGCIEQLLSINIEIIQVEEKFAEFTICAGDIIDFEGNSYQVDSSGIYEFEILHPIGCVEQLLTFDVTVIPTIEAYQEVEICGDSGTLFFEDTEYIFDSTGIYTYLIEGESGCDEIELTIDITLYPIVNTETDTTICEGQSYEGFEVSGVYTIETVDPITGCPAFETLTLIVLPISDPACITNVLDTKLNEIEVFPIPTNNSLFLKSDIKIQRIIILSTAGKTLAKMDNLSSSELEINVSQLPVGFHFLLIETSEGRMMKKVIISK